MFDRDRRAKHAPQALAFFIEQNGPFRVVVTNLDSATAIPFHADLLAKPDLAIDTVNSDFTPASENS
jgi:hypothetical protein